MNFRYIRLEKWYTYIIQFLYTLDISNKIKIFLIYQLIHPKLLFYILNKKKCKGTSVRWIFNKK